ncbi:MAG: aminoglycoside phosphotransferase family protein [Candidatus Obscuribacterales bacterium]|nr:aminoglycoside phosphotransferase family protein [Candidatus Obscuribacterales bacterium]
MRENWNRATQTLEFTTRELTKMIEPVFPKRQVLASFYTQGGLANTNIKLKVSDSDTPLILRVFTRDPSQGPKEFSIYQRLKGTLAVPAVYYFGESNPVSNHPYIIMQHVDGDRLETLVAGLDDSWSVETGRSVGSTLAAIHAVKFPHEGFLDGELNVFSPLTMGSVGFMQFAHHCLGQQLVQQRLGPDLQGRVERFLNKEAVLLDQWQGPASLTHCDFNGSNVLIQRTKSTWKVTAVLDWEFAISANPFIDFGNLLRDPIGSVYKFQESVFEGYTESGGMLPPRWRELSRLSDLMAWFDFLSRPDAGTRLISDACGVIERTMSEWT